MQFNDCWSSKTTLSDSGERTLQLTRMALRAVYINRAILWYQEGYRSAGIGLCGRLAEAAS